MQNGKAEEGGALWVTGYQTRNQIRKCVFKDNQANKGGVVYGTLTWVSFDSCEFFNNTASAGGVGFNENECGISFYHSTLRNNHAGSGGVFHAIYESGAAFFDCHIFENSAGTGGALVSGWYDGGVYLEGTSVHNNIATSRGGAVFIENSWSSLSFSQTNQLSRK